MTDYVVEEIGETPYLYVEGESTLDQDAIAAEMGRRLREVREFMETHGIAPVGPPLAVYPAHFPERLAFRAGIAVASEALLSASGRVGADCLPSGRVLSFTHVGPHATLRDHYADMMAFAEREGLRLGAPTWELYLDDPEEVPQERLRTRVHVALE